MQTGSTSSNNFPNNYGDANSNNITNGTNATRSYPLLSTEWVSVIGEELEMHPLPDPILRRLAEDASYRLREVLYVSKQIIGPKRSSKKLYVQWSSYI